LINFFKKGDQAMNIKYFFLIVLMAGIFLLHFEVSAVLAQKEDQTTFDQPTISQPVFSTPTDATASALAIPSQNLSPTPGLTPTGGITTEAQPPPGSAFNLGSSSSIPQPQFAGQASPAAISTPQVGFSLFNWKGFINFDSFLDQFWGTRFQSSMDGWQQSSSRGDPDGVGRIMIETYPASGKICFVLKTSGITDPQNITIYQGRIGSNGDPAVVLPLILTQGVGSGCLQIDYDLLKDIRKNPFNYYINITTNQYPDGAIRGQLSR
jgi:hypothetical protein